MKTLIVWLSNQKISKSENNYIVEDDNSYLGFQIREQSTSQSPKYLYEVGNHAPPKSDILAMFNTPSVLKRTWKYVKIEN